jgi:hypothetical protein
LQYPETGHVLLGFQVWPVSDQHLTTRQGPQGLRGAWQLQAASEKPGTGSLHLFVEHVDIAAHCFVLDGRVVVIRVVNRYQKLLHVFSYIVVRGRPFAPFIFWTNGRTRIRQIVDANLCRKARVEERSQIFAVDGVRLFALGRFLFVESCSRLSATEGLPQYQVERR